MTRFTSIELHYEKIGYKIIAGLDEAGRGPWAGPVVTAAVIFDSKTRILHLKDSKMVTSEKRYQLYKVITEKCVYAIGKASNIEIDKFGLIKAINLAFNRAIDNLPVKPDFLIIDGRDKFTFEIPFKCFIKGDENIRSVCQAGIIAKVTRDEIMKEYAKKYPIYKFQYHKGYGTRKHQEIISKYGISPLHRLSFKPIAKLTHE